MVLTVDVISDVICPWCFIVNGKVALSGAQELKAFLEAFERASDGPQAEGEGGSCSVGTGGEPSC